MMDEIIKYRDEQKIRHFKEDPNDLVHFLNSDEENADNYAGREILELLQNAIDPKGVNKRIKIQLLDNILTVCNTGEPFDVNGIKSLMVSHTSNKSKDSGNIGYKGVGFRSVLNFTDCIEIHSGDIHVRFSESDAKKLASENGFRALPMMVVPVPIAPCKDNDYNTNIIFRIKDGNQVCRIRNQIHDLNPNTFLFLKDSFEYLEVEVDGHRDEYRRLRKDFDNGEACVEIKFNDVEYSFREFYKDLKYDGEDCHIAIIYDPNCNINDNRLYSYFETNIDFPIKWRVHGTFDLSSDRNQLIKKEKNKFLLQEIVKLICESATKISDAVDYKAFEILEEHGRFATGILEDADLNDMYEQAFRTTAIFPTVHNTYISCDDTPVFYQLICKSIFQICQSLTSYCYLRMMG